MKLPIDVSRLTFICGRAPMMATRFESNEPRTNRDGVTLYQVELMVMGDDRPDVLVVKVPGEPKGIGQGMVVRPVDLVATPWSNPERSGVSFDATRLDPVGKAVGREQAA
jgi:hypothetical protein